MSANPLRRYRAAITLRRGGPDTWSTVVEYYQTRFGPKDLVAHILTSKFDWRIHDWYDLRIRSGKRRYETPEVMFDVVWGLDNVNFEDCYGYGDGGIYVSVQHHAGPVLPPVDGARPSFVYEVVRTSVHHDADAPTICITYHRSHMDRETFARALPNPKCCDRCVTRIEVSEYSSPPRFIDAYDDAGDCMRHASLAFDRMTDDQIATVAALCPGLPILRSVVADLAPTADRSSLLLIKAGRCPGDLSQGRRGRACGDAARKDRGRGGADLHGDPAGRVVPAGEPRERQHIVRERERHHQDSRDHSRRLGALLARRH